MAKLQNKNYPETPTGKEQARDFNESPVTFHSNNLDVPLYLTANHLKSFSNVDRRIMVNKQRRKTQPTS